MLIIYLEINKNDLITEIMIIIPLKLFNILLHENSMDIWYTKNIIFFMFFEYNTILMLLFSFLIKLY